MAFSHPPAHDASALVQLPVELQEVIYKDLDSMRSVNNLRATCQHIHAVFAGAHGIVAAQRNHIVNSFTSYCDILERHSCKDKYVCRPKPVWNITELRHKTEYLQSVIRAMPYMRSDHYDIDGREVSYVLGYAYLGDFLTWYRSAYVDDVSKLSSDQIALTGSKNLWLNVLNATVSCGRAEEELDEFLRRQLMCKIKKGELGCYRLSRGF